MLKPRFLVHVLLVTDNLAHLDDEVLADLPEDRFGLAAVCKVFAWDVSMRQATMTDAQWEAITDACQSLRHQRHVVGLGMTVDGQRFQLRRHAV